MLQKATSPPDERQGKRKDHSDRLGGERFRGVNPRPETMGSGTRLGLDSRHLHQDGK